LGRASSRNIEVNVNQGNLPPVVRVARDVIEVRSNEPLVLDARQSSDPNQDCGDEIVSFEWDMKADGLNLAGQAQADYTGNTVEIPVGDWQQAMGWNQNDTLIVRLTLRDSQGGVSSKNIQVKAVDADPIPLITQIANPSPYRFHDGHSSTRLDGRESFSLIEGITIQRYEWDIGCDGSYEREQGQFLYERSSHPIHLLKRFKVILFLSVYG
jgi:hypothetical protein